jgi:hypothetical protein
MIKMLEIKDGIPEFWSTVFRSQDLFCYGY